MGLVSVARYADLQEARIAATRLDSAGIMSLVPEAQMGQTNFLLGQAMGGYRLCVIEEDLLAAREILTGCRIENPEALKWREHPEAVSSAAPSIFWAVTDPTGGFAWSRLRKKFTVTAFLGLLLGFLVIAVFGAALIGAGR